MIPTSNAPVTRARGSGDASLGTVGPWAVLALAALALAAPALLPPAAQAAFPGTNGEIAYSSGGSLHVVDPGRLGARSHAVPGGRGGRPAFSPLGLRLAFDRRVGGNRDIWIAQADGSGRRRLTGAPAGDEHPAWSPTAGLVAWARKQGTNRDIVSANADGSGLRRVTASSYDDFAPAWSPGGKIAFVRDVWGNDEIHTVNPDGRGLKRLTRSFADDGSPSWSPDSRKLLFVRSGNVHVINRDGTGLRRLTRSGGLDPAWSPDGTEIAFSRGRAGNREIYVVSASGRGTPRRITAEPADARDPDWQSTGHDPVIAAAGDIACDPSSSFFKGGAGTSGDCRQRYTANLLLDMDLDKVATLGDNQYTEGALSQFAGSYDASWGRAKSITRPSAGNHEYRTPDAAGYFDYFNGVGSSTGPAGDRGKGYYSYDVGDSWHVVVLNSSCGYPTPTANVVGGCNAGSPQETWLRADLAANRRPCTLAYWHHPLFSSYKDASSGQQEMFWRDLYDADADLILNGHVHSYERYGPQDPSGKLDTARGIRQIVVGTGGKSHSNPTPTPNIEKSKTGTYGVLQLTLKPGAYRWRFVPEPGKTFTDSGTTRCH